MKVISEEEYYEKTIGDNELKILTCSRDLSGHNAMYGTPAILTWLGKGNNPEYKIEQLYDGETQGWHYTIYELK